MDNKRQHDPSKYAPYKLDELMKGNMVVRYKNWLKISKYVLLYKTLPL
jgi:hypothetical protein